MAIRGETIGRAYVRILADGSGFPESVREEVRRSEPEFERGGRRTGEAYSKAFKERVSQEDIGKSLRDSLERGLARGDIAKKYFASRNWDRFVGRLKEEAGDAGVLAARELEVEFRDNIDGLPDAIEDIGPRIRAASERLSDAARRGGAGLRELRDAIDGAGDEANRRQSVFRRLAATFERGTGRVHRFADAFGAFTGRGSRNNFLNFFGSVTRNLTRLFGTLLQLPAMLVKVGDAGRNFFTKFSEGFNNVLAGGGGGLQAFIGGLSTAGVSVSSLLSVLPALIAVLVILPGIIGAVVTAFSMLLGVVTALAITLGAGLVGAILPLVGLLAPLALGVGVVASAFFGMDKAAKQALKESVLPLKEGLEDLATAARPGVLKGIEVAAKNLRGPIKQLEPLFRITGDAVATFAGALTELGFGPGFDGFIHVMEDQMPSIMGRLGRIFGRTFDVLFQVFAQLNAEGGPVDQFLDWLTKITKQWDTGINSVAGKKDVNSFFDGAVESAKILWDVITGIVDIFAELTKSGGKKAGDEMFKGIGDAIGDIVKWLRDNPDVVEKWFEDVTEFGKALGDLVKGVFEVFDALDNPRNRKIVTVIVKIFANFFTNVGKGLKTLDSATSDAFHGIGAVIRFFFNNIIAPGARAFLRAMASMVDGIGSLLGAMGKIPGSPKFLDEAARDAHNAADEMRGLADSIKDIPSQKEINITTHMWTVRHETKETQGGPIRGAAGFLTHGPTKALIGEAGPEAVVPLNRNLAQVDPAVRELSAIAQGKRIPWMAGGGIAGGRSIDVGGIQVITPTEDPRAVATEVLNELVARVALN